MNIQIGYACLAIGVYGSQIKSIKLSHLTNERLLEVIANNLNALDCQLDYIIKNQIKLFRISSDIIPMGSHPMNTVEWWVIYKDKLKKIGEKIIKNGIRVSMHPGQYTVINSPDDQVVKRSIQELHYHGLFLESLKLGDEHKMILHIGGKYDDKAKAIERFITQVNGLDPSLKNRLVLENDHKIFNAEEVLAICKQVHLPMVFDNLHHQINGSPTYKSEYDWIVCAQSTWESKDGVQKIHYAQQRNLGPIGAHAQSIAIQPFIKTLEELSDLPLHMMLEVKDKNLSAIKCNLIVNHLGGKKLGQNNKKQTLQAIEKEWARYKYYILSKSVIAYQEIRNYLKDKELVDPIRFYEMIDAAMVLPENRGQMVNALQHVFGYVSERMEAPKRQLVIRKIAQYHESGVGLNRIKNEIFRAAELQQQTYLLDSLFFYL